MRLDSSFFNTDNLLGSKDPRYVIGIDFDGTVQYLTSHDDIANVPGTPIQDVIQGISATSQTLNPDRANATIGSMTFDIVDLANAFTNRVRAELDQNDVGLRGRTVTFHMGYVSENDGAGILDPSSTDDNPDFDNFALFQTQIIRSVQTKEGRYSVACADIQRETKKQIFDLALTYLTTSIDAATTTIAVLDLSGFEGNFHGTSYTDAPSADVIYIRLDSTKEIIRCPVSGISGNSFTGVTRGVLGTEAKAVDVDPASASDRRPKVEEYVYLELPAVKLAYAILTGVIEGTANTLPTSWHAGVPTSFVRLNDFKTIGDDLWVPTDDTLGVVLRFDGIDKQDAKKFLETELYLLLGLFSPVYADGQLGLKRMVPSLSDSPFVFSVDDSNAIATGNLIHDMESMQNNLRIDWNWNGERFIRSTIVVDSASITRHGKAPEKRLGFRGLASTRFTEQVLRQLLTSLRDMYTGPPLRLDVSGFHLMNQIEVGDACRVSLTNIRDYTQPGANLDRTMVVHGMTVDWLSGVKLKLFGSSERADEIPPVAAAQCLLNAFYAQEGTNLSTISGLMSGNVTNAGTFTLVGSADMNAAASIFYWDAPLTISVGTTLNIEGNVQLRVRGFLTINGTIDGTGNGHPTDANLFDLDQHYFWRDDEQAGTPGFIGNCASHHGLLIRINDIPNWVQVTDAFFTPGRFDSFPNLILEVTDTGSGAIIGIPTDMRGSGGAFGPRAGNREGLFGRTNQKATGGAGGAGGSALCIVCRGGDFGAGGQITLDGLDGVEPTTFYSVNGFHIYGGAGGAGSPGALLWLIDGSSQTFPDLAGHFQAKTGEVPAQFALPTLEGVNQNRNLVDVNAPVKNMAPFVPFDRISGFDQSGVNFRISFLPCEVPPEEDQPGIISAPINIAAAPIVQGVQVTWTNTNQERDDVLTQVYRANENVRISAIRIGTVAGDTFFDSTIDLDRERFYWVRAVDGNGNTSAFEPDTSTTTASTFPGGPQAQLCKDGLIRLGVAQWNLFSQFGTTPTYDVGAGTKGTDVINFDGDQGAGQQWCRHKERRGPNEFDFESALGMVLEVRVRWRYSVAGTGSWTTSSSLQIVTTEEDESNPTGYIVPGSIRIWDENDTVGEWAEYTAVVELFFEDFFTVKPRYITVQVNGFGNANSAEYQVDLLDATVVGRMFDGADQSGFVKAPVTQTGLFLKDDGTFDTPAGGGGFTIDQHDYQFSTSVSMFDPGAGFLRFNNATPASITQFDISDIRTDSRDIDADVLANVVLGSVLRVVDAADLTVFLTFTVTAIFNGSGFYIFTVSYKSGSIIPANNANITIDIQPSPLFDISTTPALGSLMAYDVTLDNFVPSFTRGTLKQPSVGLTQLATSDAILEFFSASRIRTNTTLHVAEQAATDALILGTVGGNYFIGTGATSASHLDLSAHVGALSVRINEGSTLMILETANALADITGYGQFWVRDDQAPMFTPEGGGDIVLSATGGDVSRTGTPLNNQIAIFTDATTIEGVAGLTFDGTNLSATQFGGIPEARLVDKDLIENINGLWAFAGGLKLPDNDNVFFGTDGDITFDFNATDLVLAAVIGTPDWNITGFGSINAGTVDADFDALTATSFGGILSANLLSRIASESVSGSYTFTNTVKIRATNIAVLRLEDANAPTNEEIWAIRSAAGAFQLQTFTDAGAFGETAVQIDRTGTVVDSVNFFAPITADTYDGVNLTTAGAATNYLDETGNYSVPAGGGSGTVTSVSAGNGMNFTTITVSGPVTLGTPTTLDGGTTNVVTSTSHAHQINTIGTGGILAETNPVMGGTPRVNRLRIGGASSNYVDLNFTSSILDVTENGAIEIRFPSGGLNLNMRDNAIQAAILDDYSIKSDVTAISSNAATITYISAQAHEIDLAAATGNVTITLSGGPPSGEYGEMIVKVIQDSTARTITWAGGTFNWPAGLQPTASPGNDDVDIYHFSTWDAGSTWWGTVALDMA